MYGGIEPYFFNNSRDAWIESLEESNRQYIFKDRSCYMLFLNRSEIGMTIPEYNNMDQKDLLRKYEDEIKNFIFEYLVEYKSIRYLNTFIPTPIDNPPESLSDIPTHSFLSDSLSKDLKKRGFKFVGTTIVYSFLQATGYINDHVSNCWVRKELNVPRTSNNAILILKSGKFLILIRLKN